MPVITNDTKDRTDTQNSTNTTHKPKNTFVEKRSIFLLMYIS